MARQKQEPDSAGQNGDGEITGVIAPQQVFRHLLQQMSLTASMDASDASANLVQIAAVEAILSAEDEDEMWEADERGPLGGRNLPDVEQELTGFSVKYSRDPNMGTIFVTEDGKRLYLLVESTRLDTGESIVWNTSAPLLVAKIMWLDRRNKLPYGCVIRSTDLGGGKAVLKLKRIPVRPERIV